MAVTNVLAVGGSMPAEASTRPRRSTTSAATAGSPLGVPVGYGRNTTGGAGGAIYHVTTASDDAVHPAAGSLRWALTQQSPLWVVFDGDYTIHLKAGLRVGPNKTIDGRGHKVTLTGHGLPGLQLYSTHNVIIESLTLRDFGDIALTWSNDP